MLRAWQHSHDLVKNLEIGPITMGSDNSVTQPFYHLTNADTSVLVDCRQRLPAIVYVGCRLASVEEADLALVDRHEAPASLPTETPIALLPDATSGWLGHPGIAVRRGRQSWQLHAVLLQVSQSQSAALVLLAACSVTQTRLRFELALPAAGRALSVRVTITNDSLSDTLSLDECNLTLPIPDHLEGFTDLSGRWGLEFQSQGHSLTQIEYSRENRTGRSSHRGAASVIVHETPLSESQGQALACHLAWSGNHRVRIEQLTDGRRYCQLGELLAPEEIVLQPGTTYSSPTVWCVFSSEGLSGLSRQWHRLIREQFPTVAALQHKPRPVQLNTWEALYFDINESTLLHLIEQAAQLGVERFVLDDGWFAGRNDDRTSLGDWWADPIKLPRGLAPLVAACKQFDMEFGLWVEPEMVNPDSELYRCHPEWVLHHDPSPRMVARNQLVLDLARPEVQAHLFEALAALLNDHDIRYLKWDMNRDIHQAGNALGYPTSSHQTHGFYRLLDRVKTAFPHVEIEGCASGGGRVDCGVLSYVSRFWPSDTNDALDRLGVQKGFSLFYPPELMGCHIGPETCHLTGRQHTLDFRGGVAFWGHLGIEMDIRTLDERDQSTLMALIQLHKDHRQLLHGGQAQRLERPKEEMAWGVVSGSQQEALFGHAQLASALRPFPVRYRFQGLDARAQYQVRCIWPPIDSDYLAEHAAALQARPLSGDVLMQLGMTLPIRKPESLLIYHLSAV